MLEADGIRSGAMKTDRVTVRRRPQRGAYDEATIFAILDATFLCHVGFVLDGHPFVIPTSFGRAGRTIYIHGAAASRMLRELSTGVAVCVTVTVLDGLVLARSIFHHSVNYRSVVILGSATPCEGEEKLRGLEVVSDHIIPGRWAEVRPPNAIELRTTSLLKLEITEASAKIRQGPPIDDEEDYALGCWAGVLPLRLAPQEPLSDPRLATGIAVPDYVRAFPARQR
ncbi:MAG TPA: pyridoxamine 5'-phosphate oxidase family protein [Xanthobacteraceae bacterium]|nr:pyridoxamine 5'-phosphate oxidase family protein [Xanthobacteraceae bacterium]